jgi:hypothetical protein
LPFRNNAAFSCLAIEGADLHPGGTIPVDGELQVSDSPPVDLDGAWEQWLGTIQAANFRESGLVITAQRDIPRLQAVVPSQLEHRAHLFHFCLLLQGCAYGGGGLMVSGNTENGHLHVGPLGPVEAHPRPEYRRFSRTTAERVAEGAALLPGAELIYGGGNAIFRPYRRVRLGFNSWIFGLRSLHTDHRLHWFVRSLEAILKLPRRRITAAFVARGQELVGFSRRNEKMLQQLYNLRSCVEHVKEFRRELRKPRGVQKDQAFAFWSLCAELLASEVYKKILLRPDLRNCFQDEKKADGFWRRTPIRRAELIGPPIDAWALARRSFRQMPAEPWL